MEKQLYCVYCCDTLFAICDKEHLEEIKREASEIEKEEYGIEDFDEVVVEKIEINKKILDWF